MDLHALRTEMSELELDAWLVPSADPHQSEYVAPCWERRAWASGFDGSAGTLVVVAGSAGLWTDSRYWLQAAEQLEGSGIDLFKAGDEGVPTWDAWLASTLTEGQRVGANPWVHSLKGWRDLAKKLEAPGVELVARAEDLVDRVWGADRPALPSTQLRVHAPELAGETVADKLGRVEAALADAGADALLVCALDEVAWLFNLRGADVEFNPVFVGWALVGREQTTLFTDLSRVGEVVRATLPDAVRLRPYDEVEAALGQAGQDGHTVWVDPKTTSYHLARLLQDAGATLHEAAGPLAPWKATKNPAEVDGMRAAHVRDGVAMVRFLRWLEGAVPEGGVTELSAEAELESLRARNEQFVGPSFRTIAGYGGHGAIVHYAATEASSAELLPEGLFLIDSGGQYLDGTTDITRTLALGEPTDLHRRAYTAVLRGHLALSRATFRAGTKGFQLDVLARAPVWEALLHYGHGTGHGVGAALCVHEGPFSVSPRLVEVALEPGNVLSNEPGYYLAGEFGIRIENVVLVVERAQTEDGTFLGFEDLTLCPYDRRLIDVGALCEADRDQVDAYHARVREVLSPLLDEADRAWLEAATQPL